MANGKWSILTKGPACVCDQCGDMLLPGDDVYETDSAYYCCEACADDSEYYDEGLPDDMLCDYPD